MRLYIGYYSADSSGAREFDNEELEAVKDEVVRMLKRGDSMEEVEEYLEDEGCKYEIEGNEITLYDGYDEIRIVKLPIPPKLVSKLEKLAERIDDDALYMVDTNVGDHDYDSPLWDVPRGEVKGSDVKEYIRGWCKYVREKDEEEPGYADGYPVCQEPLYNSFAWGGYSWSWEGDVNKITIVAKDVIYSRESEWYVSFIKKVKMLAFEAHPIRPSGVG